MLLVHLLLNSLVKYVIAAGLALEVVALIRLDSVAIGIICPADGSFYNTAS